MTDRLSWRAAGWLGGMALLLAAACHSPDAAPPGEPYDLAGPIDLKTAADLPPGMWPAAMPPPAACNMRSAGVTAIQAVLRIDEYKGLQTGRNGVHEIAEATMIHTVWVYATATVDTTNIHLAMNVASGTDPAGLPMEVPMTAGQIIETEGEYIPAATAGSTNTNGAAAVIHFTHSQCGYAVIGGKTYR